MENQLERAAVQLQSRLIEWASADIEYRRDGKTAFAVEAILGQIVTDNLDSNGLALKTTTDDFIVDQVHFRRHLPDEPEPRRNDEIRHVQDGLVTIYAVNGDGFTTAHFEETDRYHVAFRIHTRKDRTLAIN